MPFNKIPSVITAPYGVHIKGLTLAPGIIKTTTYVVDTETVILVDSSGGGFDIDLTNVDGIDGRIVIIQDVTGNCYTNPVTVSNASIQGRSTLNTSYGVLGLVYSLVQSTWYSFINDIQKSGTVAGASFSGTPLTFAVFFTTAYLTNDYSVSISGDDSRIWTVESKSASGFTINSNSSTALTGNVYWTTTSHGS